MLTFCCFLCCVLLYCGRGDIGVKILLSLLLFFTLIFGCKSQPSTKKGTVPDGSERPTENAASMPTGTPIILDTPNKADIEDRLLDTRLIRNVEIGSPDSLRAAVNFIASDPNGLTDINRLYLVIISEIMTRLYPHEAITWNVPAYPQENKYLAAFSQIDTGLIPQNLDESTFLALVIPSFYSLNKTISDAELTRLEARLIKAETLVPDSVLPHFLKGVLYQKNGQASRAIESFRRAWDLDASCTQAGLYYARLLAKTGDTSMALNIAEKLGALQKTTEYQLLLSEAYIELARYEQASEIVVALLSAQPDNTEAVLLRIKILIAQQEYLKANALLDAFATRDKNNKDYLLLRSVLFSSWNKSVSSALSTLSEAYMRYPNDFDVLLACAQLCFETGQNIQGITANEFIEKVTQKDSNNVQAAALIVKNLIGNEIWNEAVPQAETLARRAPTTENERLLVRAYLGAGQVGRALPLAQRLYQASTDDESTISLYLATLTQNGAVSDALKIINAKMPSANATLKAILYYYQAVMSSGETRLGYLRSSLLSDPRNQDALFAMYQYYYANVDYKKAEYYLKQVIAIDPLNKKNQQLLQQLQSKL